MSDGDRKRHKVMGFVGIQTGFGSVGRRQSLRKTWMPSDHQGLQRYLLLSSNTIRYVYSLFFYFFLFFIIESSINL